MNILFEGINGSGKTTLINQLRKEIEAKGGKYEYIADLTTDTPLSPILKQMFSNSAFLEMKSSFKTSLFESLVLAANHHYIQEKYRNQTGLILYDRDFISVLSYQKDIIKKDYPNNWELFYHAYRTILFFELKKIDLLCYVSIPLEENINRTEQRDNRRFSKDERDLLHSLKTNMEQEICAYCKETQVPLLKLDGSLPSEINCQQIIEQLKCLKFDKSILL